MKNSGQALIDFGQIKNKDTEVVTTLLIHIKISSKNNDNDFLNDLQHAK
jgi:hypothetical protein